ncbi:MAG: response regulator [Chloroflexi bacterium]|nr:response regulator [Chloroflexota bacterium]
MVARRILIIEDDPPSLELYSYLLKAFGYSVLSATRAEDGLLMAAKQKPDLIICDVQLPGMDGSEAVRTLKADRAQRRIPVIAVTAYAMVGDRDRLLTAGFDGYIAKPIVAENFIKEIEHFFHGQNPHR